MKPVMQTRLGEHEGNCFQAAIASLFELALEDVPDFMRYRSAWWDRFASWCAERALEPVEIDVNEDSYYFTPRGYYLVSGGSPRGDFLHTVIHKGGRLAHDPHPDGGGVTYVRHITFFMRLFDPRLKEAGRPQIEQPS